MHSLSRIAPLALTLALIWAGPAFAATFTVTTTEDVRICNQLTCGLRAAVEAANANGDAEDDLIVVPAGVYRLGDQLNVTGTRITIAGAGADRTIIEPVEVGRVLLAAFNASLTVRDATLRNGFVTNAEAGGNVWVQSSASLTLQRVRVTNGRAGRGGGIATAGAARLDISQSLIDGNSAQGANTFGGGIFVEGQTLSTAVTIQDSTITGNSAPFGGGIAVTNNVAEPPVLRGVTLARNTGGGGLLTSQAAARIQGSILAGNTVTQSVGSGQITQPANCAVQGGVTDEGGNIESDDTCGLSDASRVNTDPMLAAALDATAQPPVLAIAPTSPAVDFAACGGRTVDQRGVPRPQGARCDAGAYEYDPPPETSVAGAAPPFVFSASDPGSTFECSLNGGPFVPCSSPWNEPLPPGTYTLVVRAVDPQGNVDGTPVTRTFVVAAPLEQPQPQPTPTAVPTPEPTPVAGRTVVAREVRGTVRIRKRGSRRFVNLGPAESIPVGSTVDARRGTVEIAAIPRRGRPVEKAEFRAGIFRITQSRGITDLRLTEKLSCSRRASAAQRKKVKKRRLWGKGSGRFRTTGSYAAATVRGTEWLVQDTCTSTLVRVREGSVTVRDKVARRTIIVRAGRRYVARARR